MRRLTLDGRDGLTFMRYQILRRERGQGNNLSSYSADHEDRVGDHTWWIHTPLKVPTKSNGDSIVMHGDARK